MLVDIDTDTYSKFGGASGGESVLLGGIPPSKLRPCNHVNKDPYDLLA